MQLRDIGERKLTELIIPKFCGGAGDDCCFFPLGDSDLVVTTDPVPIPAAKAIAGDADLYWAGRLLVTINASDLAAAGATPLLFVVAAEFSPELETSDLERFLIGVADGCSKVGLSYSGGNLKEAVGFAATGTAIGSVPSGRGLRRSGVSGDDVIFSVGQGGEFWRDAFRWQAGERFEKLSSKLFAPEPQTREMAILREQVAITCAMDNSDGLLSTLDQIARVNRRQVLLDLDALTVPHSNLVALEQARLWLGWGDWNVVISVASSNVERLLRVADENSISIVRIGQFIQGVPGLVLSARGHRSLAPRLESERFVQDSWFLEGIEGYIKRLLSLPLPEVG